MGRKCNKQLTGDTVKEYLNIYPDMLSLTLARLIYKENQLLYRDVEHVRGMIRYYRHANGKGRSKSKKWKREQKPVKEWMKQFRLHEEDDQIPDYIIPVTNKKMGCLFDVHLPYHHTVSLEATLQYFQDEKVDSILIGGDLIDFYMISSFVRDPRKRNFLYEIEMAHEFFELLRAIFPKEKIFYKLGNHEARWQRFLITKAPEVLGFPEFELDQILTLKDYKVECIHDLAKIKYGHLNIVHGHEFGRTLWSPVNPARGLFLRAKANTMCGHYHQSSEHAESNIDEKLVGCWSVGSLCQLKPAYKPFAYTKWNHGAAIVEQHEDGNFSVDNFKVIRGKIRS